MVKAMLKRVWFCAWALCASAAVLAQGSPPSPARAPDSGIASGLPLGQGPGYHSPDSPFKPLAERTDVVSWKVLTAVTLRDGAKGPRPRFNPTQQALSDKTQRIQGFMMPLEPGQKQKHFLLTSVPLTCAFCIPGGPESMVEVYVTERVAYTLEPLVVEGKFAVLPDDPFGLYYRLQNGKVVR